MHFLSRLSRCIYGSEAWFWKELSCGGTEVLGESGRMIVAMTRSHEHGGVLRSVAAEGVISLRRGQGIARESFLEPDCARPDTWH